MLCTNIVWNAKTKKLFLYTTCCELVFFLELMNKQSYCGLIESRMRASDIDLPVKRKLEFIFSAQSTLTVLPLYNSLVELDATS